MNKKEFMKLARNVARETNRLNKEVAIECGEKHDRVVLEKTEKNEDGQWEAFYHDSKTIYFISEDGTFNYACSR